MDGPDSSRQPERRCVEAACLVSEGSSSNGLGWCPALFVLRDSPGSDIFIFG